MIVLPMPAGFLPRRIKDMTTLQSPPVTAAGPTRRGAHPLYTLLIDMVAPIALFYGIRGFGGSVWLAPGRPAEAGARGQRPGRACSSARRVDLAGLVMKAIAWHRQLACSR